MIESIIKAIILGVVEGLTEFIPVSSTGHLIILGELLKFEDKAAKCFDVFIQLGAILAVVWLYRGIFIGFVKDLCGGKEIIGRKRSALESVDNTTSSGRISDSINDNDINNIEAGSSPSFASKKGLFLLFLTTLPAMVLGAIFYGIIKEYLFGSYSVSLALATGALLIFLVEIILRPSSNIDSLDKLSWKEAVAIGFFQCISLWPGFSRSAATIIGARLIGVERKVAAVYSFLAAVPVMLAATVFDLYKSWQLLEAKDLIVFSVGFIFSFLSAVLAIRVFIGLLRRWTLVPFGVYRLVVAAATYWFFVR